MTSSDGETIQGGTLSIHSKKVLTEDTIQGGILFKGGPGLWLRKYGN